jgi:glycosyltransferase involved in cell wall biosynthesis
MKVLQVIPSLSWVHGGPSRAIRVIEHALIAQGISVETIATDDDGNGRRLQRAHGEALIEEGGVRRYFRKWFDFYIVAPGMLVWLLRNVRHYDVVHAQFSFASLAGAWVARRACVPYIIRPLGTLSRYSLQSRRPWVKKLSLLLLEKRLLRDAAAVHFTSELEQQEALALGVSLRSRVIPLAVEAVPVPSRATAEQHFPELINSDVVLYLSRIDPKKNMEGLFRAFALCALGRPRLTLLVVGDGSTTYVSSLHTLARELGIEQKIVWAGHLSGEAKAAAFGIASVFALPSFSENFGIAAVEALAAGVPSVLSEGVAIAADAREAGAAVVTTTEPESIAEAISTLIDDTAARQHMSDLARAFAEQNYSVCAMGRSLFDLYNDVVDERTRR